MKSVGLLAAVQRALSEIGLNAESEGRVLVACSGGRDSGVLAHASCEILGGRQVLIAHVDHAVRPQSAEDGRVVATLAELLHVPVFSRRLAPGPDDEARLRDERYAALEAMRLESEAAWILVAHTRDDQAETVLLGWLRKTHPEPPWGMPARRGRVVRPMLSVAREAVWAYAAHHHLPVVDDPSNLEPRYMRNRVRKELIPLLESRYRPGLVRRLAAWGNAPAAAPDGGASAPPPASNQPPWPQLHIRHLPSVPPGPPPDGSQQAVFDAEGVSLSIRPYAAGDRIQAFGMQGRRKVADVLREGGIEAGLRSLYPLVVDAKDRVMWVPGLLRSSHAPISSSTGPVWVLEVSSASCCRGQAGRSSSLGGDPIPPDLEPSGRR